MIDLPTMELIRYNELTASPWKNSGGVTRELACHPPGAGLDDFLWRVSIADVAASGPFSNFPGIDRIIMLMDGNGMNLQFDDGKRYALTEALQPYRFPGEAPLFAHLAGNASTDFNLMMRRDQIDGEVCVWRDTGVASDALVLLHCASGEWQVGEHRLQARDTLRGAIEAGTAMQPLQHDSTLVGVRIVTRSDASGSQFGI